MRMGPQPSTSAVRSARARPQDAAQAWWPELLAKAAHAVDFLVVHPYPVYGWDYHDYAYGNIGLNGEVLALPYPCYMLLVTASCHPTLIKPLAHSTLTGFMVRRASNGRRPGPALPRSAAGAGGRERHA